MAHSHLQTALMISTLLILLICAVGLMVSTTIVTNLYQAIHLTQDIAEGEGDLRKRLDIASKDELGELAKWINTFIEKLHHIIGQTAEATQQVASASSELSATAEQIAAGTEQTSTQADTVASATEQMSATAQEIAQNCTDAVQTADMTTTAIDNGQDVVQQSISGMDQIASRMQQSTKTITALRTSAEKIGEISHVIDDIASQTNLLALNAAIEAARAGEQGRGFAVVADEVRKLAESTAQSTQEITGMIKRIQTETQSAAALMAEGVGEVEAGSSLAAQAGDALQTIAHQVTQVTDMIRMVATAAEQQTATTEDIAQNIQQVAEVTNQSSQGAQQSAQAAAGLTMLSTQLQKLVGQFQL